MVPESEVSQRIECMPPAQCDACGASVQPDGDKPMRHQVFELPEVKPLVSEYVRLRGICSGCGRKHHAALPAGVPSGQLGPRALALVGTLAGQFHLTQRKVQAVLSQLMGIQFSLGAVSRSARRWSSPWHSCTTSYNALPCATPMRPATRATVTRCGVGIGQWAVPAARTISRAACTISLSSWPYS